MPDPFAPIDSAYSATVTQAVADHEHAVAGASAQLAADLANAADAEERDLLLADYDAAIAPARDAYTNAVAKAEQTREQAKAAAQAAHDAFHDAEANTAKALQAKLAAGTATAAEVQTALSTLVVKS